MAILINPYRFAAVGDVNPHWQELGRTTLGVAGDTISVTGLETKPYMMIIPYVYDTGSSQVYGQGTFNGDTGGNYANRWSSNGGSDTTEGSASSMRTYFAGAAYGEFGLFNLMNVAAQEKIMLGGGVAADATGAGTAPKRREIVTKWANTTNAVSRFDYVNGGGGTFDTGSEVVVLGYDPSDEEGTSVWEELKSVSLSSAADSMDSGTFTAKKYLWVQIEYTATGGNLVNSVTFNSDSGSNYARRGSDNGGTDATDTSASKISSGLNSDINSGESAFFNMFIINKSDKEKLVIAELISTEAGTGAGNAPDRAEFVAKWTNTSSQITSIQVPDLSSGQYNTGSSIKVWGFD